MLRLEALLIRKAHPLSQFLTGRPVDELHLPAQGCRRKRERPDRVTDIVLTVSKRAFPVFPGLPHVNRAQADQERPLSERRPQGGPHLREVGPGLDGVREAGVVSQQRRLGKTWNRRQEKMRLGRVEVAARRVDSQCPARRAGLFPGRERERLVKKLSERSAVESNRRGRIPEEGVPGRHGRRRHPLELQLRRAVVGPERVRLARPVEVTKRARVAVGMMLGTLVVGEDDLDGGSLALIHRRRTSRPWEV